MFLIYNQNSSGGNYLYIQCLFPKIQARLNGKAILLLPRNADLSGIGVLKVLMKDRLGQRHSVITKLYFILRSFINPFILIAHLLRTKSNAVLFNDFDQVSAPFWVPCIKYFFARRSFGVILHDPDRDQYFKIRFLSRWTMGLIMSGMHYCFYHGHLPDRPYYLSNSSCSRRTIPHGIYPMDHVVDNKLLDDILSFKGHDLLIGLIGNIRDEKNYDLVLSATSRLKGYKVLIAGNPANSAVKVSRYRQFVRSLGIEERVMWLERYLSEAEFNAVIAAADLFCLYYSRSFVSQSGVLNRVAPFKKGLIVSDAESPLSEIVRKFNLGILVTPDSEADLLRVLTELKMPFVKEGAWEAYFEYASWENAASEILEAFSSNTHVKA